MTDNHLSYQERTANNRITKEDLLYYKSLESSVTYTELGQKTNAQIEYTIGYGGKYRLITDLALSGRGIKQTGDGSDHKRGKKTYYATEKAFTKLKESYSTSYMASL